LKTIDRAVDKHLAIHAICDNYSTHKTPEVKAWLDKHPRVKLHFIPTSSSWLNLVERLFAEITSASDAACSKASTISRPPSPPGSMIATQTQSHSNGRPAPLRSSPKTTARETGLSRSGWVPYE
jgi:hypothetical protein